MTDSEEDFKIFKKCAEMGLTFQRQVRWVGIIGYLDSNYEGSLDERRSLTNYVFSLSSSVIRWKATLQSVVALSTTEAECIIITEAMKDVIWLQGLVSDLGLVQ